MSDAFSTLPLKPELLSTLEHLGFAKMTPIQAQSLPHILAGDDVIGEGQTGSGKTAAFGLGLLQALDVKRFRIQTLVLCPTRELADQVAQEIRTLARGIHNIKVLTLCGGMPFGPQIGSLEHGAHIVVGTPGRVEEHVRKGTLRLDNVNQFVLDEADRMLDMGFQETLDDIIEYLPSDRQTLLFSATFPKEIASIAKRVLTEPTHIVADQQHDSSTIEQRFYDIDGLGEHSGPHDDVDLRRLDAIQRLLCDMRPTSTVIFCNTKRETQQLSRQLNGLGFDTCGLHGDLEQRDRDRALVKFASKSVSVLVATDVAARGLDIEGLDAVFNYSIARELAVHTHRIGRTGRAGRSGTACTLFSHAKESFKLKKLQEAHNVVAELNELPKDAVLKAGSFKAPMVTLQIDGGKKQKVRKGDILGALTKDGGISGSDVGNIKLNDRNAYVSVSRKMATDALEQLGNGKIKGRNFRARQV